MSGFIGKGGRALSVAAALVAVFVWTAAAQQKGTFTDGRDGHKYKTVKIGKQRWMAENLNYQTENGSWCNENKADNCKKYGRLYEWNAAVCPDGWHLPSLQEWEVLVAAAGGFDNAGKKLKSKSGWNEKGASTDNYGFSALPGGWRDVRGDFFLKRNEGLWWTATEVNEGAAAYYILMYNKSGKMDVLDDGDKKKGHSVRCVKEN